MPGVTAERTTRQIVAVAERCGSAREEEQRLCGLQLLDTVTSSIFERIKLACCKNSGAHHPDAFFLSYA